MKCVFVQIVGLALTRNEAFAKGVSRLRAVVRDRVGWQPAAQSGRRCVAP